DLDALHAQLQQLAEHLLLFLDVPRLAERLVAVTQRDVVEERPAAVRGVDGNDAGYVVRPVHGILPFRVRSCSLIRSAGKTARLLRGPLLLFPFPGFGASKASKPQGTEIGRKEKARSKKRAFFPNASLPLRRLG